MNRPPSRWPGRLLGGLAITGLLLGIAALSLVWTPQPPGRMRIAERLRPPLASGLLGTDAFGHDILSMLMAGAVTSLTIALAAVAIGAAVGTGFGALAAARRGWVETLVLRSADVAFAFPAVMSALMIAAVTGPGRGTAVLAIGLFMVPVFTRLTHGAARRIWVLDYCRAAEAVGQGPFAITVRHVLPAIAGTLAVQATTQVGLSILAEAGLSFLGLSVAPPVPSWGRMLGDAATYLDRAPWMALAPGLAIALAVAGFGLLGDGLRDWLDPRRGG